MPVRWSALAAGLIVALSVGFGPGQAQAQVTRHTPEASSASLLDARDAVRRRDSERLAGAIAALQAARDPLLPWAEYWALGLRLKDADAAEVEAFHQRWPGSYLSQRLRGDWLDELGRRRDFAAIATEYPRLGQAGDPEQRCWWLLTEHLAGKAVREPAMAAWRESKQADEGCQMLATALLDTGQIQANDVWDKARRAIVQHRPATARAALGLLRVPVASEVAAALAQPERYLRNRGGQTAHQLQLRVLALMTLAQDDPPSAATLLAEDPLPRALAGWTWAYIGRQAAFKLLPDAAAHYQRALQAIGGRAEALALDDDTLAYGVRAALRNLGGAERWALVLQLIGAMAPESQAEPAWAYWQAQALLGSAAAGPAGDAQRSRAHAQMVALASWPGATHYYGQLAAEDLGVAPGWGPAAPVSTEAERSAARKHPGLQRAWALNALGLRSDGWREWRFALGELDARQRLAAAREACAQEDWQWCINTAERVDEHIDLALRYPQPHAAAIRTASQRHDLDAATVFGLIRQETRFMAQLRSHVGATGLMQVMPGTAKLVARRIGLSPCCSVAQIGDLETNLQLGTHYLRGVLDRLDGSFAMAAAGYNAGPGRPRRWREGPELDAAVWVENIPFNETRGYVQAVLANTAVYAALAARETPRLRSWLGQTVGPAKVERGPDADDDR